MNELRWECNICGARGFTDSGRFPERHTDPKTQNECPITREVVEFVRPATTNQIVTGCHDCPFFSDHCCAHCTLDKSLDRADFDEDTKVPTRCPLRKMSAIMVQLRMA